MAFLTILLIFLGVAVMGRDDVLGIILEALSGSRGDPQRPGTETGPHENQKT
jgi:hypothetical protein